MKKNWQKAVPSVFLDGQIKEELPAGKEGVLMVQV